jgi:hypothetical protein
MINTIVIHPDLPGDGEFFLSEFESEYSSYVLDVYPSFTGEDPVTVISLHPLEDDMLYPLFRINPSFWVDLLKNNHSVSLIDTLKEETWILKSRIFNGEPGFSICRAIE